MGGLGKWMGGDRRTGYKRVGGDGRYWMGGWVMMGGMHWVSGW